MDFSFEGKLATGDNDGKIHIFAHHYREASLYYESTKSVEDIQWSPTETTVLAAGEAGGLVKIYDTRAPKKTMLTKTIDTSTDVNAVAWSKLVTNLLATGCDDGKWSVWDLRKFEQPLARFTSHTTPITSLEWHPTDESMIVVSDEVGSFVYDLSVEEEEGQQQEDLPPQLLFVHSGSPHTKEVHWHPQITSLLMSTAYDGFHAFIPSNL
jgi:ribosome assembly protein RRB1